MLSNSTTDPCLGCFLAALFVSAVRIPQPVVLVVPYSRNCRFSLSLCLMLHGSVCVPLPMAAPQEPSGEAGGSCCFPLHAEYVCEGLPARLNTLVPASCLPSWSRKHSKVSARLYLEQHCHLTWCPVFICFAVLVRGLKYSTMICQLEIDVS